MPLAVFAFGFSVMSLSLANAELFNLNASLFVPVAFGTGALGMLIGGSMEYRNGNLYGRRSASSTPASCSRPR